MGYNGRLSLKLLEKSVKVENLPCPLLRGQPLKWVDGWMLGGSQADKALCLTPCDVSVTVRAI